MAYIEPNTEIWFCSDVPLDPDYENTLYFESRAAQYNYFSTLVARRFSKNSYQRKSRGWLRIGWNDGEHQGSVIADMYNANYMMFKNTNFENKWFYAFVDRVEYINNNCVEVQYHIDVMQTWHFDYVFNQCFIERQHTPTDELGEHTIDEGLETGPYYNEPVEYLWNNTQLNNSGQYEYTPAVCIAASFDIVEITDFIHIVNVRKVEGRKIDGLKENAAFYTGAYYYIWELTTANVAEINEFLELATKGALIDGIISVFMLPLEFTSILNPSAPIPVQDLQFFFPQEIDGYEPRNKKVYNYPYTFFYVSNNQGNTAEYMLEAFKDNIVKLRLYGNVSPNAGMMCWPVNYKGHTGNNFDEALTVSGFPMCTWTYDSFKAWLAQNSGTIAASAIALAGAWMTAGASAEAIMATNAANGAFDTMMANGGISANGTIHLGEWTPKEMFNPPQPSQGLLAATLGAVGRYYDYAKKPPQAKGNGNIDLNYQCGLMTFNFYYKHIKSEYARILDKYFDMYGYKINTVGVPNRAVRTCYTYVKTIGCSIHGHIPCDDVITIQNIFNNGVRFWKPNAVFGNYDPNVNPNLVL